MGQSMPESDSCEKNCKSFSQCNDLLTTHLVPRIDKERRNVPPRAVLSWVIGSTMTIPQVAIPSS
jgi:hypothetical protein